MDKSVLIALIIVSISAFSANATNPIDVDDFERTSELGKTALRNKNFDSAYIYLNKASKLGDKVSQFKLAILYMEGLGVKQDYTKAYLWLNVASEYNHNKWRKVRDQLLGALSKEQVEALAPLVEDYIAKYGAKTQDISCSRRAALGSQHKVIQCRKYITKFMSPKR